MPTASSEASTRAASLQSAQGDALDKVRELSARGEAHAEESLAETVQAFAYLVRAVVPSVVSQPAQAVDAVFEFVQHSLNMQRRLLHELLSALQVVTLETGWDNAATAGPSRSNPASSRRRTTRNAA